MRSHWADAVSDNLCGANASPLPPTHHHHRIETRRGARTGARAFVSVGQPLSSPCLLLSPPRGESRRRWEEGCGRAATPPNHNPHFPSLPPSPRCKAAWGGG